jgi:hypothetical protein
MSGRTVNFWESGVKVILIAPLDTLFYSYNAPIYLVGLHKRRESQILSYWIETWLFSR